MERDRRGRKKEGRPARETIGECDAAGRDGVEEDWRGASEQGAASLSSSSGIGTWRNLRGDGVEVEFEQAAQRRMRISEHAVRGGRRMHTAAAASSE
ncbi:hypothetical protein Syun_016448 [Stephania yunnanensis]|uniref:Uncharacterized protein n=1 Tax=Stephania yunnanensis TaxID=152371 RepID=A0AAP0J7I5_9MAGN